MTTGYRIELGYNANLDMDDIEAWEYVEAAALRMISAEAMEYGAPEVLDGEPLANYAYAFKERKDLTITFQKSSDGIPYIHMYASGGDPGRTLKAHTRRAFIRLLLQEAHRKGIELNITVS